MPWLKPTARNKMFNAVIRARAAVGSFHQLSSIPPRSEKAKHQANLEQVILPLLKLADREETLAGPTHQRRDDVEHVGVDHCLQALLAVQVRLDAGSRGAASRRA